MHHAPWAAPRIPGKGCVVSHHMGPNNAAAGSHIPLVGRGRCAKREMRALAPSTSDRMLRVSNMQRHAKIYLLAGQQANMAGALVSPKAWDKSLSRQSTG